MNLKPPLRVISSLRVLLHREQGAVTHLRLVHRHSATHGSQLRSLAATCSRQTLPFVRAPLLWSLCIEFLEKKWKAFFGQILWFLYRTQ